VVDVFDALTTDRPYRKALPTKTAYKILFTEAESGWWSTELVERFVRLHRSNSLGPLPEGVGLLQPLCVEA
jgi:HD-GYP domain-containing protein (c-di-GMP phosphodiesterase class II)